MTPTGLIFNVQRFSMHDGPGLRTTVFMKGCPLACSWCHNPESQALSPAFVRLSQRCMKCGRCTDDELASPTVAGKTECDVDDCPTGALQMIGERIDALALVQRVLRDRVFFDESHGGVTISGGEPLVQSPFVIDVLKRLRAEGVHTALDTCGFAPWENLRDTAVLSDLVLFDLKLMDSARHEAATGVGNERILANLRALATVHANIWIRFPVVPAINDDDANVEATAAFLCTLHPAPRVSLLPYHPTGEAKFARLGKHYSLHGTATPAPQQLDAIATRFRERGLMATIGGHSRMSSVHTAHTATSARTERLRRESLAAVPSISAERAAITTAFYKATLGRYSTPVMRAMNFYELCDKKTLWMGDGELIVGERGPSPKAVPTYPELTCHSAEDLRILDSRPKTSYKVAPAVIEEYEREIIPYWRGRSLRDVMMEQLPPEWHDAYAAGCFTEFMEQRAPGHTVADGKIYQKGMLGFKADIAAAIDALDFEHDPEALDKREQLRAMSIACDAVMRFAERHADMAAVEALTTEDETRRLELLKVAYVCRHVPANAPRDFHEALQMYWFCHLAVITELNGWDAFSPGHLDQHLGPFYDAGLADGTLTRESARELLECFFIKFNNHTAPPKVGVTAAESGTYTDFANINLAGLKRDGSDGSNEVTHLLLEVIDDFHLLQPSSNMQVSRRTPDAVLKQALRVIRNGYGFPSLFNADAVVEEQLRQGKTIEDAREGGCSGCVEVGAFGKEAYILTGYFNLMKMLELALHDGFDVRTGKYVGARTGDPATFATFDDLFDAFEAQVRHVLDIKIRGNQLIERLYATRMPHTFLSVITDDCIATGKDYNAGGARYNNTFIQAVGIGSITDSLSALKDLVYDRHDLPLARFVHVLDADFSGEEVLRQRLINKTHKYGNDDDYADALMTRTFMMLFEAIDGRPNTKGGAYRLEMLPTTCHVYFGEVCEASADGRMKGLPVSEGISPVQGADRTGPTAVLKSAAKMDHIKTGGTLLNMKFSPSLLAGDLGIDNLHALVRGYFKLDGHHMQFNVVSADMLRDAKANPAAHRDLIVRVAGYSDYFCDLSEALQDEIIRRTEHADF